jgi:hypothetical protein
LNVLTKPTRLDICETQRLLPGFTFEVCGVTSPLPVRRTRTFVAAGYSHIPNGLAIPIVQSDALSRPQTVRLTGRLRATSACGKVAMVSYAGAKRKPTVGANRNNARRKAPGRDSGIARHI